MGKNIHVPSYNNRLQNPPHRMEWKSSEKSRVKGHLGILGEKSGENKISAATSSPQTWQSSHLSLVLCRKTNNKNSCPNRWHINQTNQHEPIEHF